MASVAAIARAAKVVRIILSVAFRLMVFVLEQLIKKRHRTQNEWPVHLPFILLFAAMFFSNVLLMVDCDKSSVEFC